MDNINLTSPEIAALWSTYLQSTAENCFYKHFLQHTSDVEIKPLLEEALVLNEGYIQEIKAIFTTEIFPIPVGFSDKDVDLSAPALFTDLFALSFVYRSGQILINNFSTYLGKVARTDVVNVFDNGLTTRKSLYTKSLDLMLSKGIYDRPPKMSYPKNVEFIDHPSSLIKAWFGEERSLNAFELGELFFAIERNCIGLIIMIGLIQVTNDQEVKDYLIKGKKLSEKQIEVFNQILKDNGNFPTFPVTLEVTDSTVSPFSDKLIMFLISVTGQLGFTTLSYAMSVSARKDLAVRYTTFIGEILKYGNEGLKIMIKRGWIEQPPQSPNRADLLK
ncbi:DUF3231 family protein [Alkalihalobacillus sp. AL-G]|uniref:DUF3231 family protein n=1 Tax=Alkalihalobacillus sp. AL-G TaxID=2926399 RepID=UPI00272CC024|nr:DUF3231 family protein [Alkalihalobacillus sp. AL-G]WLD95261.1 DUF3231 family protein [Alkalihalobacillus sp. AL-G]